MSRGAVLTILCIHRTSRLSLHLSETPLRTPQVYFAEHDLETDDFVLVMQDVGHLRAADQIAGELDASNFTDLIETARHEAVAVVAADPALGGQPALAAAIRDLLDPEREAYLDRG